MSTVYILFVATYVFWQNVNLEFAIHPYHMELKDPSISWKKYRDWFVDEFMKFSWTIYHSHLAYFWT